MSKKISITLDNEVLDFVDQNTNNRSQFINTLLWQEKQRIFMKELAEAYQDQAGDPEFQAEASLWDTTIGDGLGEDEDA
ncbi:hypothetical protein RIF25_15685 [Thermosynechococcaceae cyanobacterium BACA0444]|uniref:Uncharacterized protein n=1 Tax=Pseudocalidococcus azoricus BACA0444 TaxID=2918990 RepID=A0AAE4K0W4_9CYAN|nr:hypothetical protein [Pseudocalidococcus azoricus]MDS3862242.1 hypothetical protein [Pseudocalidococcus azoricus BACA0444]